MKSNRGTLDGEQFVARIAGVFQPGRTLLLGEADDWLRNLLASGWDVHVLKGSPLAVQELSHTYETIICCGGMDTLAETEVEKVLRGMYEAVTRTIVCVVTLPPLEGSESCIRTRAWWESKFFYAGFRRHPLYQVVTPYEELENEIGFVVMVFEKISEAVLKKHSLEQLLAHRTLHMDMLRESGRRSDAHVARYMLAAQYVRPNDTVLDCACGLGYGSALLWDATQASAVIGVDLTERGIAYARDNYGEGRPGLSYHVGNAQDLSFLEDRSVDLIVSMETVEHLPEPELFFQEASRVLKPGGRVILSVPNMWVDESGKDPNPYHFHVFDREKIRGLVARFLDVEQMFLQIAGGGMKLPDGRRVMREVSLDVGQEPEAEWWLVVGMKNPVSDAPYQETVFRSYRDIEQNIVAFERQYERPWIQHALVGIGYRANSRQLRQTLAERFLEQSPPRTPDRGAALCVLGYQALFSQDEVPQTILEQLAAYLEHEPETPLEVRWAISNAYLLGHLYLSIGERDEARRWFEQCAGYEFLRFSPLIATKTVDACYFLGLLSFADGDRETARHYWQKGLEMVQQAVGAQDWSNVFGDVRFPLAFGMQEMGDLFDLASRCARSLSLTADPVVRPNLVMQVFHSHKAARLKMLEKSFELNQSWIHDLQTGKDWLEHQYHEWKQRSEEQERQLKAQEQRLQELQTWLEELTKGKDWLEEQYYNWMRTAKEREMELNRLNEARLRLEEQLGQRQKGDKG
jgi:2-polyprenyl-3-methyl-5-hydroxy-6-metoxy-1,4-benzoquinol methylase/tetratricopeptide (TPR) repeat protein